EGDRTMEAAPLETTTHPAQAMEVSSMKAIIQDSYGSVAKDVLRFGEAPRPAPGDDEVLVRVVAASVDRGTWHVMSGLPYPMRAAGFGMSKPKSLNPGRCLAGVVESFGKDVTGYKPGDEVYGTCSGTFAEYACVQAKKLAPKPANLTFAQAATAPISGLTALQAVRKADVQPGEKVLVIGASGGVGSFAAQIAKASGAEVTGVGTASKVDMIRSLGVDHVVDYTREDFLDGQIRYDVIIDTGGNSDLAALRRALTPAGRLVIVGGETDGKWFGALTRTFKSILVGPFARQKLQGLMSVENSDDLIALKEMIESGSVTPAVDRTYPLSQTAAAIQYVQDGRARGKVVIDVEGVLGH
ncbi:MAG: NAD(P)-dependent alcohol dehydrogenase, partial [Actinomycetota bacterium]